MTFDIAAYKRKTAPVRDEDIDYAAFADRPLSQAALRCLRYMCDVENYTVCYLRDMLVTPSHKDPEVTTFMTMWNYEEYWHGEVLAKVLAAHGIETDDQHIRDVRLANGWKDKIGPIQQAVLANLVGDDFVAVHMTWGAINEWSTHAGYQRLIDEERHPVLTDVLSRIMQQETRHIAFYATQARERLDRSPRAQRLTRFLVRHFWGPVGSSVMSRADTRHLLSYLLGGSEGARVIDRLDEKIDKLPGLSGLNAVQRAAAKWEVTTAAA